MASPQIEGGFTRISHELLETYLLVSRNLSPYENTLWWAIVRKTYGFKKKTDWISNSQLTKLTGILGPHIIRTKKKLLAYHMIVKKGREIGIQKDWEKWCIPYKGKIEKYKGEFIRFKTKQPIQEVKENDTVIPNDPKEKDYQPTIT